MGPRSVRVREVSPRELGVHAAIREPDSKGELPPYIARDFDTDLRAAVSEGRERGCFLLLVGPSSVGKTRSAYEALLALVPDWPLTQPETAADVSALARGSFRDTVVWLDELQRYLGPEGLSAAPVRSLRRAGAIVIGTLWPGEYLASVAPRQNHDDPHQDDRELLRMAQVVDVADALTGAERRRAVALGGRDSRIRTALSVSDAGVIQALAAGPALVRWWEQSPDPYANAVITAAADARRLGVRHPLPRAFFTDAVPGYLTPARRATAARDWLDTALAYALTPLHGATATLLPAPAGLGAVAGYQVADYLLQHARRSRRAAVPPTTWWRALGEHCDDKGDLSRLAQAAMARARFECVELLYRRRGDDGDAEAASAVAEVLARKGWIDEAIQVLGNPAVVRVPFVSRRLTELLLEQDRVAEAVSLLWPHDDGQDGRPWHDADKLSELLIKLDRADDAVALLRSRADAGDRDCAERLATLLGRLGRTDEAIAVLREHTDRPYLKLRLARALEKSGNVDEAVEVLQTCAAVWEGCAEVLVNMLAEHGRVDELRSLSVRGNDLATWKLADLFAEQGRAQELAALVDAHGHDAMFSFAVRGWLADVLTDQDDVDELRRRADAGDERARYAYAETLLERGQLDEVRSCAAAGDQQATLRLAQHLRGLGRLDAAIEVLRSFGGTTATADLLFDLLVAAGRIEEAIEKAPAGVEPSKLNWFLRDHDRLDDLRSRAQDGDEDAAWWLAKKLAESGRVDEALDALRLRENDNSVALFRAELLKKQGNLEALRGLAETGDEWAIRGLVDLLVEEDRTEELRALAKAGLRFATYRLIILLAGRGQVDELREWADTGEREAARHLTKLLAEQGRIDDLRAEVDAGTEDALPRLITALIAKGELDQRGANELRARGFPAEVPTAR